MIEALIDCYQCDEEFYVEGPSRELVDEGAVWDVYVALWLKGQDDRGRCPSCKHKHNAEWLTSRLDHAYQQDRRDEVDQARDDSLEFMRGLRNDERSG